MLAVVINAEERECVWGGGGEERVESNVSVKSFYSYSYLKEKRWLEISFSVVICIFHVIVFLWLLSVPKQIIILERSVTRDASL